MKSRRTHLDRRYAAICGVILLHLLGGCSDHDSRRTVTAPFTVAAIGNSITDGLEVGKANAYPLLLQHKLREEGFLAADVADEGIPGTTLTYWNGSVGGVVTDDEAAVVIIELGTNDALPTHYVADQVRAEVLAIQQQAYDAGAVPFFVTPPGICANGDVIYGAQEQNTLAIAEIMREVVDSKRIIDASKQFHKDANRCTKLMATRNHPNERGHQLITDLAYDRIAPVLDDILPDEPAEPDIIIN